MNKLKFPAGKLPIEYLESIIDQLPTESHELVAGPGIGFDCAVVDTGTNYQVLTTDPITFTTKELGWYLVQVNANDIATTGAVPKWLLLTLLLPTGKTDEEFVNKITLQIGDACREKNIVVIGGHSEITHGVNRPIAVGTMIGEVDYDELMTPKDAQPGDHLLLTKSVPIEATAILSREFPERLEHVLSPEELETAQNYIYHPGISVLKEAQLATQAGGVSAMHDPTEGGLFAALWEMSFACQHSVHITKENIPISAISRKICDEFQMDPFQSIASGALIIATAKSNVRPIQEALRSAGIQCTDIGEIREGKPGLYEKSGAESIPIELPQRDEIARIFEQ